MVRIAWTPVAFAFVVLAFTEMTAATPLVAQDEPGEGDCWVCYFEGEDCEVQPDGTVVCNEIETECQDAEEHDGEDGRVNCKNDMNGDWCDTSEYEECGSPSDAEEQMMVLMDAGRIEVSFPPGIWASSCPASSPMQRPTWTLLHESGLSIRSLLD